MSGMAAGASVPPVHVAHLVHRFSVGGLENVVAQLIDHLPAERFRHTVVAVSDIDPSFAERVQRKDVEWVSFNKPPGQPYAQYPRFVRLMKQLQPQVLHSCNLAALDFVPAAAWAGVKRRIHAEHGWSADDARGSNVKKQWLRRAYRPWVQDTVAVSDEIAHYLRDRIRYPAERIHLIENGVDVQRFQPSTAVPPADFPWAPEAHCIVGCVGRMEPVKNHALLLRALAKARAQDAIALQRLRLVMVGDGPLRAETQQLVQTLQLDDAVWMPGQRADVAAMLNAMRVFVLCSLAEGTSCALQEALAAGADVIATRVGANARLLNGGEFGTLIASEDEAALTRALVARAHQPRTDADRQRTHRHAAANFSLQATVGHYARLFASAAT